MQTIALISGLIGALASGALAFGVRIYLDQRAQREAERRLAYVHLVSVTEYVAIEIAVVSYAKAYVSDDTVAKFRAEDGAYELPHAISAFLSEAILKTQPIEGKHKSRIRHLSKYAATLLASENEVRLSPEQLSKLPRSLVVASYEFQAHHASVCLLVDLWVDMLGSEDRSWVTPSWFQDQWRSVVRFSQAARRLRDELILYGAATKEEGYRILLRRALAAHEMFAAQISDNSKLEAAQAVAKSFLDDERMNA